MTTAIIGTGGLGSAIARQLASGGETLRLSSADTESARTLAAQIGGAAIVADGNRDALQGAGAVILALRFTVLKSVIDEISGPLAGKVVVVPSNPLTADARGNVTTSRPHRPPNRRHPCRGAVQNLCRWHGDRAYDRSRQGDRCRMLPPTGYGSARDSTTAAGDRGRASGRAHE